MAREEAVNNPNSTNHHQRTTCTKSRLLVDNGAANNDSSEQNQGRAAASPAPVNTSSTSSSMIAPHTRMFVLPRSNIDVFGFMLTPGQSALVFILAFLMLGANGGLAFAIALSAYTGFQRITASSNTTSGGTNRRRGVGWSGGGANIRGVKDLPKDPSGG